jgi:FixJ family two-component response regulator
MQAGADDFISKPFDLQKLTETISRWSRISAE